MIPTPPASRVIGAECPSASRTTPNATTTNAAGPTSVRTRSPVSGWSVAAPLNCHTSTATPTITVVTSSQNRTRSRPDATPDGVAKITTISISVASPPNAACTGDSARAMLPGSRTDTTRAAALAAPKHTAEAAITRQNRRAARVIVGSAAICRLSTAAQSCRARETMSQTAPSTRYGSRSNPKTTSTATVVARIAIIPRSRGRPSLLMIAFVRVRDSRVPSAPEHRS
jgi:hypothetical protein